MRDNGAVDLYPVREFAFELFHLQRTSGDLLELRCECGWRVRRHR